MKTFPKITTPRLLLDALREKDIPQIVLYAGDWKVAATTVNIPYPYNERDARTWIKKANEGFQKDRQCTFAIRLKGSEEMIGSIGLIIERRHDRASIGYWIAPPYWGRGIATEAVKAVIQFGLDEMGLNRIYANHLIENPASGKVMIKNGMIKEAALKDHFKKDGQYRSVIQYRLTKSEFDKLQKHGSDHSEN